MPTLNDRLIEWIYENYPQIVAEAWAGIDEEPPTGPPSNPGRPDGVVVPPGITLTDERQPRFWQDYIGREDEIPPAPGFKSL